MDGNCSTVAIAAEIPKHNATADIGKPSKENAAARMARGVNAPSVGHLSYKTPMPHWINSQKSVG